jgi:hypothetical protein
MKKGWWETGERTIIKSDGVYEIWHSKHLQKEYMECNCVDHNDSKNRNR